MKKLNPAHISINKTSLLVILLWTKDLKNEIITTGQKRTLSFEESTFIACVQDLTNSIHPDSFTEVDVKQAFMELDIQRIDFDEFIKQQV